MAGTEFDLLINPGAEGGNYGAVPQAKRPKPSDIVAVWPPPPYVRPAHLPPRPLEPITKRDRERARAREENAAKREAKRIERETAADNVVEAPAKPAPPPNETVDEKRKRTKRGTTPEPLPPKKWTTVAIAKAMGIGIDSLRDAAAKDPELQRLLDMPGGKRRHGRVSSGEGSGRDVTDADVVRAARQFRESQPDHMYPWCPRLKLLCCLSCGTHKRDHAGHGLCTVCYEYARKPAWQQPWCPSKGTHACNVCGLADKPHFSHGRCRPCAVWAFSAAKRGIKPEDYAAEKRAEDECNDDDSPHR